MNERFLIDKVETFSKKGSKLLKNINTQISSRRCGEFYGFFRFLNGKGIR